MRCWVIGSDLFVSAVCLALGPSDANVGKSGGDAQTPGASPSSGPGRALDFQVIHRQTKEPIAGADLEIRLGGDSMRDVTNAQGRCRIEYGSQQPDYLSVRVSKPGLVPMQVAWRARELHTPIPDSYILALEPGTSIGGIIQDESGKPIAGVTVYVLVPGSDSGDNRPIYWERRQARPLTDGRYEITFGEPRPGHLVRIEAEGYLPEVSRAFDDGEGRVTFDFALRKGAGLSGMICLPDGKPVAGAEVILCTSAQGAYLRNGRKERASGSTSVETGQDGRFAFPAQTDPYTLVVLHDQGYVQVTDDELNASSTVTLRPWGRVEGQVRIGSQPGANQDVRLMFDMPSKPGAPRIYHEGSTVTDKDGQFVCERVPPGRASIGREIRVGERSRRFAQMTPIEIKAGETTSVMNRRDGPARDGQSAGSR